MTAGGLRRRRARGALARDRHGRSWKKKRGLAKEDRGESSRERRQELNDGQLGNGIISHARPAFWRWPTLGHRWHTSPNSRLTTWQGERRALFFSSQNGGTAAEPRADFFCASCLRGLTLSCVNQRRSNPARTSLVWSKPLVVVALTRDNGRPFSFRYLAGFLVFFEFLRPCWSCCRRRWSCPACRSRALR